MNFEKYYTKKESPNKANYGVKDIIEGHVILTPEDNERFQKDKAEYWEDVVRLVHLFKNDLFEELNITKNPKKELLWDFILSYSTYSSDLDIKFEDIYRMASDAVKLIR